MHELIEEQVRKVPEAVAVVYEGRQLTYAELNARANQLAHYLRKLGVKPETRVAICVERSLEMMVGLLGILKAGGCYVPLDPGISGRAAQLHAEGQRSRGTADRSARARQRTPEGAEARNRCGSSIGRCSAMERSAGNQSGTRTGDGLAPSHLAYVIYTSGSTGQPKGVMIEQPGVIESTCAGLRARYYRLGSGHRFSGSAPIGFDGLGDTVSTPTGGGSSWWSPLPAGHRRWSGWRRRAPVKSECTRW